MSQKAIQVEAEAIARKVGVGKRVGFVEILIPILTSLLPLLIEKFKGCTSSNPVPSSPQKFVQHRYDDETGEYDRKLLKLTMEDVKEKSRDKGQKLTKNEIREIAIATLDHTRLAENNVVGACFRR